MKIYYFKALILAHKETTVNIKIYNKEKNFTKISIKWKITHKKRFGRKI